MSKTRNSVTMSKVPVAKTVIFEKQEQIYSVCIEFRNILWDIVYKKEYPKKITILVE